MFNNLRLLHILLGLLLLVTVTGCSTSAPQESRTFNPQTPSLLADRALMDDGYELPLRYWLPTTEPVAIVLALHGFNDYHNAFAAVGPLLAAQRIQTYAYDQRGFGATAHRGIWAGTERLVEDAQTMVDLLRQKHPQLPLYLLGESMGGAVSITTVTATDGQLVDGVILVAPAVWARQTMPWYQRWGLAAARAIAPNWRPTGKSLQRQASDNIDMLRALGRDPLVIKQTRIDTVAGLADLMDAALAAAPQLSSPTLILYGEQDQIIPKPPTCQMLRTLPDNADWRLGLYPNGYHMLTRDLDGSRVVSDIAAWILTPQQALPSGHQADTTDWNERLCQQV